MRIGIGIGTSWDPTADAEDLVAEAQRVEADGFASGWFANTSGMDAIMSAALSAWETETTEFGTAVVPTYPHHPLVMAQQALSASAVARGRFTLGIGFSHQLVAQEMLGIARTKRFNHMEEYLAVLAPLIREGTVGHAGDEFQVTAKLVVPGATPCPILVGAMAPRMLALAGAVADGAITWVTGAKTVRDHIVPHVAEAAAEAGRPAPRIVVGLPIAVTEEIVAARASAAQQFAVFADLPPYRAVFEREGVEGPAGVAIVGDEGDADEALDDLAAAGASDYIAIPFAVPGDEDAIERTRAFLSARARR